MSRERQEKVVALLDGIRRICAAQRRIVTDIRDEEWFRDLDPSEIGAGKEEGPAGNREEGELLLEVGRPKRMPCPPLPDSLSGWIATPRWEDFHVDDVEPHASMTRVTEQMGQVVMRFYDSERRTREFAAWRKERAKWRNGERRKQEEQKLFDDLYRVYERCRQHAEKVELIAGNGFLFGEESRVDHPLVLKRVYLRYSGKERLQLIDAQEEVEFYREIFRGQEDIGEDLLRALQRKIATSGIHPLQGNLGEHILKDLASSLGPGFRYSAKGLQPLPSDRFVIYGRPVLFLRRRDPGREKLVSAIMSRLEEVEDAPLPLLDIVDGKEQGDRVEGGPLPDAEEGAPDTLLAKAANAEQMEILRKLGGASAVVVQGPPGTGKTHTIANLLGHFLAQGRHVLVTSSTRKALRILKDRLPEGIRNLCVSLLEHSHGDMDRSVTGICEVLERSDPEGLEREAQLLRKDREEVLQTIRAYRDRALRIHRMEKKKDAFSFGGESYSLSAMARFLRSHERLLEVIPGQVQEGKEIPLTREELSLLYGSNGTFSRQDLKEMGENLPRSSRILSPDDVESLLRQQESLGEREKGLLQELPDWSVEDQQVFYRHEQIVVEFQQEAFLAAEADYRQMDFLWMDSPWAREAVLAGRQAGSARRAWEQMGRDIERVQFLKEEALVPLLGHTVEYPDEYLVDDRVLDDLGAMELSFGEQGGMSLFQRIFRGRWRKLARKIRVDGHGLRSREDCALAGRHLQLAQMRQKVSREWNQLLVYCGEATYEDLWDSEDDADDICRVRWEQIKYCLDWYDRRRDSFWEHLGEAGVKTEKMLPEDERFMTPRQQMAMEIRWLQGSWPQCAALIRLECIEKQALLKTFRQRIEALSDRRSQLSKRLATALQGRKIEAYRRDYEKLLYYESMEDKFRERAGLLARLAAAAPDWAAAIACQRGISGVQEVPEGLEEAWKCRQFLQQLERAIPGAPADGELLQQGRARLLFLTAALVEKLAWQHFLREVRDSGKRGSLMAWYKETKQGEGGRRSTRRARTLRKQIAELQPIIPAWIMPLDRVWETLRPESRKFDVIIVDEASQADITALPLLYFGHKVIVLGDDKQVAPEGISLTGEERFSLEESIAPYDMDASLYDAARMRFETRMLKEHFRSVPEIIGYSNQLVYDNLIQPLRESSGSLLKPVVSYEVDGKKDRERPVNWREAEEIVVLMMACMEQPEYEGRTFGAIAMQGEEQGRLIREIALRRVGIPGLEERQFLCGTPATFQGDERDIVFLSLVEDKNSLQETVQGDFIKRCYNVAASRPRDQLWVIHSMGIGDLALDDIRRGLLEYAASPEDQAEAPAEEGIPVTAFQREVAEALRRRDFHVEEQWPVGAYRIPTAVLFQEKRAAIVCEGEEGDAGEAQFLEEQRKEAVMERLGWVFLRLRGSEFYRAPEKAMDRISEELRRLGILSLGQEWDGQSVGKMRSDLLMRVMESAARIREEWRKEDLQEKG